MPTVRISAHVILWPKCCACCLAPAQTTLETSATRVTGIKVIHTDRKSWPVPCCSRCLPHVQAWRELPGRVLALERERDSIFARASADPEPPEETEAEVELSEARSAESAARLRVVMFRVLFWGLMALVALLALFVLLCISLCGGSPAFIVVFAFLGALAVIVGAVFFLAGRQSRQALRRASWEVEGAAARVEEEAPARVAELRRLHPLFGTTQISRRKRPRHGWPSCDG
jgi:hypothetical protein